MKPLVFLLFLLALPAATLAAQKSDFSCRFYTKHMEEYRRTQPPVGAKFPWQMRHISGVIYGAYFGVTKQSFSQSANPAFERYVQDVYKACKAAPTADARDIAISAAWKLQSSEQVVNSSNDPDWMTKAVDELRKEPKIVDVMFPDNRPTSLWISVRDDGSSRDGFAEYACLTLHGVGMPAKNLTVIHVWDAAAMARDEMKELGKNECEFSE